MVAQRQVQNRPFSVDRVIFSEADRRKIPFPAPRRQQAAVGVRGPEPTIVSATRATLNTGSWRWQRGAELAERCALRTRFHTGLSKPPSFCSSATQAYHKKMISDPLEKHAAPRSSQQPRCHDKQVSQCPVCLNPTGPQKLHLSVPTQLDNSSHGPSGIFIKKNLIKILFEQHGLADIWERVCGELVVRTASDLVLVRENGVHALKLTRTQEKALLRLVSLPMLFQMDADADVLRRVESRMDWQNQPNGF